MRWEVEIGLLNCIRSVYFNGLHSFVAVTQFVDYSIDTPKFDND